MRWRGAQTTILGALALLLLGAGIWHAASVTKPGDDPARADTRAKPRGAVATPHLAVPSGGRAAATTPATAPAGGSTLYVTVGPTPAGPPLPSGFLGLSFEFSALEAYAGGASALDGAFVQLLRNLGPPLVLRIGGNSTDATWWPVRGSATPRGVSYALTPAWLASARALAGAADAKLILGVNLAAGSPRLAGVEARELLRGVGPGNVAALEIGNEPDVYALFPRYSDSHGPVFARRPGYDLRAFLREAAREAAALPAAPLAGPATAELPWLSEIAAVAAAEPRLQVVTVHRYALQGCQTSHSSPAYPSVANLLSDRSSASLAGALAPYVASAHQRGLSFRVDELNSAAQAGCLGRDAVSDTFASGLWMLNTLFEMARVGVDGVNVHTLPGAGYELFTVTRTAGGWRAFVHPDYYGMLMFAQAFPPGARLLPVQVPAGPVKVWATRSAAGRTRVALINEDASPHRVELQLPGPGTPAELESLRAPSPAATSGVTLGGQSFGAATGTGRLAGTPVLQSVSPQVLGLYSVELPAYSAALFTR